MSDPTEPFESELRSFQPQEPSSALRKRVAERLAADEAGAGRRLLRPGAWPAGGLIAACLIIGVLVWRVGLNHGPETAHVMPPPPTTRTTGRHDASMTQTIPEPTLLAYRMAVERSFHDLDALLDRHAVVLLRSNAAWEEIPSRMLAGQ